jgi:hypothetical protein
MKSFVFNEDISFEALRTGLHGSRYEVHPRNQRQVDVGMIPHMQAKNAWLCAAAVVRAALGHVKQLA